MNKRNLIAGIGSLMASASMVMAYPISLNITSTEGLWVDSVGGTLLPAGSYYQIWWSVDAAYANGGVVDEAMIGVTQGGTLYGDYVLWSGTTPDEGGFAGLYPTGTLTDAMVGGNTISDGYVYGYVYETGAPSAGDAYLMTQIYGPSTTGPWGNAGAALPPPPNEIDFAPSQGGVMGDSVNFVVPEPGTMALFGLGLLTIAARRRRTAAA